MTVCNSAWSHGTWGVFGWLVFVLLVSVRLLPRLIYGDSRCSNTNRICPQLIFAWIAITYYRQLLDPSSMRPMRTTQNQNFPMQPPPPGQGYGQNEQPWMVPPYPGPPAGDAPYEKSDYHPNAEWANDDVPYSYAPPAGAPPGSSRAARDSSEGLVHDAQEEAWQRARSGGVTAHLTGHAAAPRGRDDEDGFMVPNREEDEAWERARTGGVTAHLTGQASGSGPGSRRNENEV